MKITTERIGDAKIDIEVFSDGKFTATFNEESYTAKTMEELVEMLKRAVKKAERMNTVDVTVLGLVPRDGKSSYSSDGPFREGDGVVHAKLRGKHERQNAWLLATDDVRFDKHKFQISTYERKTAICLRLNDAEVADYLARCEKRRVAEVALEDFVGERKLDPAEALKQAAKPVTAEATK